MDWIKRLIGLKNPQGEFPTEGLLPPVRKAAPTVYTRYVFSEPTLRIAAVGDLHGRIDLLERLGSRLDALSRDRSKQLVEIYLGDYIDRGGSANAVVEFLVRRTALVDRTVICLKGNHEQMMLAALESDKDFVSWLSFGGPTTLVSYGVSPPKIQDEVRTKRMAFRAALPQHHLAFLQSLTLSHACGGFFFTHAGVRPGKPLDQQSTTDLLWIRDRFIASNADFGAVVVHGHTPVPKPQFRPNRIAIDTGAYQSGRLTCLVVTSESVSILEDAPLTVS